MKLIAKNFDITDSLKKYVAKKMDYLQDRFGMTDITVTLTNEKKNSTAQFLGSLYKGGSLIKVRASAGDPYSAVDKLHAVCKEKASRVKEYRVKKSRKREEEISGERETVRRIQVLTMTRNDALEQMLSRNYRFWFYMDRDTGLFTALYQKDDGATAVLHPVFE